MHRPKDWNNPYLKSHANKTPPEKCPCWYCMEWRAFEAGADAMLVGLRNNQWCPFDARVMKTNFRGKVVIIPDEKVT